MEPDPKQFWMIGGEAGADGESLLDGENRNIKFGFRFHRPGLWGKQVDLKRGETGLKIYVG